jgi:hypothetical protein
MEGRGDEAVSGVPEGTLEVTFDASGAAEAGRRGRVVCVVDVVDASTTAEAALANGAPAVFGAAPAGARVPVAVDPAAVARRAAEQEAGLGVVVAAEPRVGDPSAREQRAGPVLEALRDAGIGWDLVPNQGAELPGLVKLDGRVVIVVSTTGGAAFDAALAAGAPGACFATTGRVEGRTGWDVAQAGAERAVALARLAGTGLTIVAASANSADDTLAAGEIARRVIELGFLRP